MEVEEAVEVELECLDLEALEANNSLSGENQLLSELHKSGRQHPEVVYQVVSGEEQHENSLDAANNQNNDDENEQSY